MGYKIYTMRLIKHVGLAIIVASLAWSCNEGNEKPTPKNQVQQREQVQTPEQPAQTPVQQSTPSGELDKYGRAPGHAHYGHDHPPLDEEQNGQAQPGTTVQPGSPVKQQQAPASGELDKYGRAPGDEHYGHDHP